MRFPLAFLFFVIVSANANAASPPESAQSQIKAYLENYLADPYSARYTFDVWFGPTKTNYYVACGTVNAKNQFGAYTGKRLWHANFHNGIITNIDVPEPLLVDLYKYSCDRSKYD
ncbi:MAG TPA: hypothetical protein DIC56_09875 [Rhizobium sp.]|nr:hypothetical protein [Rhizobium sp.]